MKNTKSLIAILAIAGLLTLSACNDSSSAIDAPIVTAKFYRVDATNLTNNQPLSPIGVALHQSGSFWMQNQMASLALERLAEEGDNSALLNESFVSSAASGNGILPPGGMQSATVIIDMQGTLYLSVATMLVNTNDAFTGVSRLDVTNMAVGESIMFNSRAYDSGTEANSEAMGTMPGPADGGEGFNAIRDDNNFVSGHRGVVTSDDGLSTSVLNESHRFDNPVIRLRVTRTQ